MHNVPISLQALVAASIFFVWVVRYANIIQEFKQYGLPDWLRDLVGILKLTFSLLLLIGIQRAPLAVAGGSGRKEATDAAIIAVERRIFFIIWQELRCPTMSPRGDFTSGRRGDAPCFF